MPDDVRKIYFQVEDSNLESTFARLKQLANESGRTLIENANKYSRSGKDVIQYLQEEIKLRERKRNLEVDERKTDVFESYQRGLAGATTPTARARVESTFKGRMFEIREDQREFQRQTALLKDIVETLKQTARDEIREDRANVERQIQQWKEGKLEGLTPEIESKLKLQDEILNPDKGGTRAGGMFSPVFWGSLLGNVLPTVINRIGGVVSSESVFKASNSLVSAIPFLGDVIAATRERAYEAQMELQSERFGYFGATGSRRGFKGGQGVQYGYTTADVYSIASELSRNRMTQTGLGMTLDMIALERTFGIDRGQLFSLSKGDRFGGKGVMSEVGLVIAALKREGLWNENTQVQIPQYLQMMVALQEEQIRVYGRVENTRSLSNIVALGKLGDKYIRDPSYLTGISNALANPQNEFQQARALAVLSGLRPGGDLWDLQLMQEKGLNQQGYMSGILSQIRRRYGSGNMAELALFQTLKTGGANVSRQDARNIFEAYLKEPSMWDITDEKGLEGTLKKFGISTRQTARELTSDKLKDITQTTEDYTKGALPGALSLLDRTVDKLTKNLNETVDRLGKLLGVSSEDRLINQIGGLNMSASNPTSPVPFFFNTLMLNIEDAIKNTFSNKNEVVNE